MEYPKYYLVANPEDFEYGIGVSIVRVSNKEEEEKVKKSRLYKVINDNQKRLCLVGYDDENITINPFGLDVKNEEDVVNYLSKSLEKYLKENPDAYDEEEGIIYNWPACISDELYVSKITDIKKTAQNYLDWVLNQEVDGDSNMGYELMDLFQDKLDDVEERI